MNCILVLICQVADENRIKDEAQLQDFKWKLGGAFVMASDEHYNKMRAARRSISATNGNSPGDEARCFLMKEDRK